MTTDKPDRPAAQVSPAALPTLLSVMFINLLGFGIIVPLLPFYGKSFQAAGLAGGADLLRLCHRRVLRRAVLGPAVGHDRPQAILISTVTGNCLCYLALAFAPNITVAFPRAPDRRHGERQWRRDPGAISPT